MKREFRLSAIISKLCVALMSMLGYSCDDKNGGNDVPLMYGCPTGNWEIKGKVTDEGIAPVSDATIKVTLPSENSSEYSLADTRTNENGDYILSRREGLFSSLKVVCIPDDSKLEADSAIVELKYSGRNGKDIWDWGSASATVNLKLKKKNN